MTTDLSPFIPLDTASHSPLYRQIYDSIRRSILNGEFASRTRLPATRQLAEQLGVSRMTVVNAYDQLFAEGYLEGKAGSGTFVASRLPEEYLHTPKAEKVTPKRPARSIDLSGYGRHLRDNLSVIQQNHAPTIVVPFQHGAIAIDEFPFDIWSKIAQRHLKYSIRDLSLYGDPAGYLPLRRAIAQHLRSSRGVVCDEGQVIITAGTQQAVFLISRVLLSSGDSVWFEDPGHTSASDILYAAGAKIEYVPVDEEGFDLNGAIKSAGKAKLVYVTPSRQFPLGMTMSLQRRLNLLEWASENDAWIIEDDYDSEFRYSGRPLPALQGLDRHSRVLYVGTFSKTVFPGLRLGCVVVPPDLVDLFAAARALTDLHSPVTDQMILAEFIADGHFERHVRRMRTLYRERQSILISEVEKRLAGFLDIEKSDAGMHLIGWPKGVSDVTISAKAAELGIRIAPVSRYAANKLERGGLMLGYTAFDERQIKEGVKTLAKVVAGASHFTFD
ncbi:MAG TPA: PLP-dependent aminotransferase family protein [Pyrinomonadaceae bacterium]|nr:PLP-dependent aminotransferase family protein [Pyrinomonadaceae bacterium]